MNLLDTSVTPMHVVYETVRDQAAEAGVEVIESELVGLLPLAALVATARAHIKAGHLETGQIVEARLLQSLSMADPPLPA
jgi:glutamate formiminotransferase